MPASARHPHRRHTLTGLLFGVLIGSTSPGVAAHTPMDPAWPGQRPDGSLLSVLLDGGSLSLDRMRPLDQGSGDPLAPVLSAIAGTGATGQSATLPPGGDTAARVRIQQGYGRLPMHFEPNVGQADQTVRYLARGPGYTLFLTDAEAVLVLRKGPDQAPVGAGLRPTGRWKSLEETGAGRGPALATSPTPDDPGTAATPHPRDPARHPSAGRPAPTKEGSPADLPQGAVVRMRLEGASRNLTPKVEGLERQKGISNYYIGNDPTKWHSGVPHYAKVQYDAVYPGIDLVYYGNPQQLEYDFVVAPGVDPNQIRLSFEGVDGMRIDGDGNLVLGVAGGEIVQKAPRIYQRVDGQARIVAGTYVVLDEDLSGHPAEEGVVAERRASVLGFRLANYDPTLALVIDPVLVYSTYLGGSDADSGEGIAVDAAGNAYIGGLTQSLDFPTENALYPNYGGLGDVFVTKLDPQGQGPVYSTYLGGADTDYHSGIAVDAAGNAHIVGITWSSDFPTENALYASMNGFNDAFVTKLDPRGQGPVYSTYLGGASSEEGNGYVRIAVDAVGNAYIGGFTYSPDFPTKNALYPNSKGGGDAFVTKLDPQGQGPVYSTYLGGSSQDEASGIAVDAAGNAYIGGSTASLDFPTENALYPNYGGVYSDGFVTKLDPQGQGPVYSTYLYPGNSGIAVDAAGSAHIAGGTGTRAIVTKLDPQGQGPVYSTDLGGSNSDVAVGIAVDAAGNAYIAGGTASADFPTENALYPNFAGIADAFVTKIASAGSQDTYISAVSPTLVTVGQPAAFKVAGQNLPGTMIFDLPGCGTVSADGPADQRTFTCTPTQTGYLIATITNDQGSQVAGGMWGISVEELWLDRTPDPEPVSAPITVDESTRYLVLVTHGWNSYADYWPNKLVLAICNKLKGPLENGPAAGNNETVIGIDKFCYAGPPEDPKRWMVAAFNWQSEANTGYIGCADPPELGVEAGKLERCPAWSLANARRLGRTENLKIVNGSSLAYAHLIAHSAGSGFVEEFARNAKVKFPGILMQMTLLDSYCPDPDRCWYGGGVAAWVEQYFDTRDVKETQSKLPHAYNFDVTGLDRLSSIDPVSYHAFPYKYYISTAGGVPPGEYDARPVSPTDPVGAALAPWMQDPPVDPIPFLLWQIAEHGVDGMSNGPCVLEDEAGLGLSQCTSGTGQSVERYKPRAPTAAPVQSACTGQLAPSGDGVYWGIVTAETCPLALPLAAATSTLDAQTPEPGMLLATIDLEGPANRLSFDYRFTQADAPGVLQVFLDADTLVYVSTQDVHGTDWRSSGRIDISPLAAGRHYLRVVAKSQSDQQAGIEVTHILFEQAEPAIDHIGVWRPATRRFLLDGNSSNTWDGATGGDTLTASFGLSTDLPVTGDWNGDGTDEIGVWRPSTRRFLLDANGNGQWDTADGGDILTGGFGVSTDLPVVGDWDGDGKDDVGVWRPGTRRFLLDTNGNNVWEGVLGGDTLTVSFGLSTDLPVAGDWNGDGTDEIGVWRPSTRKFLLDANGNEQWDTADGGDILTGGFGLSTDLPVVGDWDGDGKDGVGVWRPGTRKFLLDTNGNNVWEGVLGGDTITVPFGLSTDLPVTGRW